MILNILLIICLIIIILIFVFDIRTLYFFLNKRLKFIWSKYWDLIFKLNEYLNHNISIATLYLVAIYCIGYYLYWLGGMLI